MSERKDPIPRTDFRDPRDFWCRRHKQVQCPRCLLDDRATWGNVNDEYDVITTPMLDYAPADEKICPMCQHPASEHGCGPTWYGWHCAILGTPASQIRKAAWD